MHAQPPSEDDIVGYALDSLSGQADNTTRSDSVSKRQQVPETCDPHLQGLMPQPRMQVGIRCFVFQDITIRALITKVL